MHKSRLPLFALVLLSLVVQSCSTKVDQTEHHITKKELKVYEKKEDASNLDCYFLDDIDAPYIRLESLKNYRMETQFAKGFPIADYTYSYSNGVLKAEQTYNEQNYSIEFDAYKDEIRSEKLIHALDIFHFGSPRDLCSADYSPIVKATVNEEDINTEKAVTFSLRDYDIDLYAYDNSVLIPFAIVNSLFFFSGEKVFSYNGKAIFESGNCYSSFAPYNSYTTEEKNRDRNQNTAVFNRNEFMFELNTYFGRKDDSVIHDFRDYAKYLDVYENLASTAPLTA